MPQLILGIDTGGTFTDFVLLDDQGQVRKWKVLSTPDDPSRAILQGLRQLLGELPGQGSEVIHGTTVGTNAFLERKGAPTCLITTWGFEDVLFIGRQARPSLYDLFAQRPKEIIGRDKVFGIKERTDASGNVILSPDNQWLTRALEFIKKSKAKTVAVCLLHSYINPENEEKIGRFLEGEGVNTYLSSRLLPEFREFERTSTTLINAYLGPVVGEYIGRLEKSIPGASLLIQQSNGGCLPAKDVESIAIGTVLSGPAGGVLAGLELGRSLGVENIITFDMGGTSTDVSLCPGKLMYTREYKIQGFPINLPMIEVHTVGAGGGSIAWIDKGGLLKVGPESAGADPGPVCYGKGEKITVTDANLFLGRLRSKSFLGGRMKLHVDRVKERMSQLGRKLQLSSQEVALGIIKLVNTNMVQALREVSIERGFDPRDFHLVSFGGAAGLHALEVAQELEMNRVIIPEMAGVFSAQGLAASDLVFEASRSLFWHTKGGRPETIDSTIDSLEAQLVAQMEKLGHDSSRREKKVFLEVRYKGQSFEIIIPYRKDWLDIFHQEHSRLYGYSLPDATVEITTVRVRLKIKRGIIPKLFPDLNKASKRETGPALTDPARLNATTDTVTFEQGRCSVPVIERSSISSDIKIKGPLLIVDDFTTILILPGWEVTNVAGHLIATRDR